MRLSGNQYPNYYFSWSNQSSVFLFWTLDLVFWVKNNKGRYRPKWRGSTKFKTCCFEEQNFETRAFRVKKVDRKADPKIHSKETSRSSLWRIISQSILSGLTYLPRVQRQLNYSKKQVKRGKPFWTWRQTNFYSVVRISHQWRKCSESFGKRKFGAVLCWYYWICWTVEGFWFWCH